MSKKVKPAIPTDVLVKRLRLMYEAGGMLTKDRLEAVRQAADRIEELDRQLAEVPDTENPLYRSNY